MILWVAEKPSVAKGVAKILSGNSYEIQKRYLIFNPIINHSQSKFNPIYYFEKYIRSKK